MEIKKDAWDKFINNAMDPNSDISNFKVNFKILTKMYGQSYIMFCKEMWKANEGVMTEVEFMMMNGQMPKSFFDKIISNP